MQGKSQEWRGVFEALAKQCSLDSEMSAIFSKELFVHGDDFVFLYPNRLRRKKRTKNKNQYPDIKYQVSNAQWP